MDINESSEACERAGLVFYRPSNGTEWMMFQEQCDRCRHNKDDGEMCPERGKNKMCAYGILDKLTYGSLFGGDEDQTYWFNPEDLVPECPATCLRFTHRDDPDGARFDPPPKDCIGQMFLDELDVPVERVPAPAGVA